MFDGEGELFDAVRDVFEPERATLPELDEHLWENTGVRTGWLFGRPPYTPDHLDDAWELFTTIKRQYFFEHADGGKLLGLQRDDNAAFLDTLSTGGAGIERHLPRVLKAINAFFCPERDEDGLSLRLWGAQQYDGHSPRVLVSCYQIAKDKFELLVPKLAPWLTDAMDYRPDHLLLRYQGKSGQSVGLRIDRGLWRGARTCRAGDADEFAFPTIRNVAPDLYHPALPVGQANPQPMENVFIYNTGLNRAHAGDSRSPQWGVRPTMTTLKDAFDDINKHESFGYLPTSSSTKPRRGKRLVSPNSWQAIRSCAAEPDGGALDTKG